MDKYVEHLAKSEQRTKVSSEYSSPAKGLLSKSEYVVVAKKGKDRCESVHGAVVAQGSDLGNTFDICSNKNCKTHRVQTSHYELTPKEREKRKNEAIKERAKAEAKKKKENAEILAAVGKIKLPVTAKTIEALFELLVGKLREDELKPVAYRHEWEPVIVEEKSYMDPKKIRKVKDWDKTFKKYFVEMTEVQKFRLIVEMLLETVWEEPRRKVMKLL